MRALFFKEQEDLSIQKAAIVCGVLHSTVAYRHYGRFADAEGHLGQQLLTVSEEIVFKNRVSL